MGGRGAASASARLDDRFYSDQRAAFADLADRAGESGSVRGMNIAQTARAAEELVGTERAAALLSDANLNRIYRETSRHYGEPGSDALGNLDRMLDNSALQKPLGSGLSDGEWQESKDRVQAARSFLNRDGYTDYEIAAALAYGRRLYRWG